MAISDLYLDFNIWIRWLHVLAGIIWIGLLYFLDFVFVPLQGSLVDWAKNTLMRTLMLHSLWWLRWGAGTSTVSGLLLFVMNYAYVQGAGFEPTVLLVDNRGITDRALWILFGMTVAAVMWFNVAFVIWPAQKKLLLSNGVSDANYGRLLLRRSTLAIRINTLLSGPALFAMLAPSHFGTITFVSWVVVLCIGVLVLWFLIRCSRFVRT